MKFKDHNEGDTDPATVALNAAAKAATIVLVKALQDAGITKGVFFMTCFDGGAPNPLATVQMVSNIPPEHVGDFLRLLLAGREAHIAPQIIVPH